MMKLVENVFARVLNRKRDAQLALAENEREMVCQLVAIQTGLDTPPDEGTPEYNRMLNSFVEIIERRRIPEEELRVNFDRALRRKAWQDVADKHDTFAAESRRTSTAAEEFGRHVADQHAKNLAQLAEMQETARIAEVNHFNAMEARARLTDTAELSIAEREIETERTSLRKRAEQLDRMLNPNSGPGSNLSAMIDTAPAALVVQTQRELAEIKKDDRQRERRDALGKRLLTAMAAVKAAQAERAAIAKSLDKLAADAAAAAQLALRWENFKWIVPKQSVPDAELSPGPSRELLKLMVSSNG